MSAESPTQAKLLPDPASSVTDAGRVAVSTPDPNLPVRAEVAAAVTDAARATPEEVQRVVGTNPVRQLGDLPRDELNALAEEYGIDATRFKERSDLVDAIHERRQLIASLDRDAMLDVVRWGRRPVAVNATKEQLAREIARIRSMRFAGLSARGLIVLARMRDIDCDVNEAVPDLIKKLRKKESFFEKVNRKRRSLIAGLVANMVGEAESTQEYQFLPGPEGTTGVAPAGPPSIKHEIEEAGLIGGISNRLKKTADGYINQKLDEIEARIDRKLDEIDRRLTEWRDKEVANRIKILKITLWASVIVGIVSLVYSYVVANLNPSPRQTPQDRVQREQSPEIARPVTPTTQGS